TADESAFSARRPVIYLNVLLMERCPNAFAIRARSTLRATRCEASEYLKIPGLLLAAGKPAALAAAWKFLKNCALSSAPPFRLMNNVPERTFGRCLSHS